MNLFVYTTHRLLEIERNFYLFIFDFHGEPPMLEESYEFGNQRNFLYDRISKKSNLYSAPCIIQVARSTAFR